MGSEFLGSCILAPPACLLLWVFSFLLLPSAMVVLAFLHRILWAWLFPSFWEPPKQCVSIAHGSCQRVFSCISGNRSHFKKLCFIQLYVLSLIHDMHWLMLPLPTFAGLVLPQLGDFTQITDLMNKRRGRNSGGAHVVLWDKVFCIILNMEDASLQLGRVGHFRRIFLGNLETQCILLHQPR